jgi:Carboxypeptidase regulatory-like domain
MRRVRAIAIAAAMIIVAAPAHSAQPAPLPAALEVLGTVTNSARPVANALVIALNLQDFAATQTFTTSDGQFVLPALRAGIYKIIAVKQGFIPAITTLVPTNSKQRVALKLESESKSRKTANQEIWELRGSLPPDILRELDLALAPQEMVAYEIPRFRGEMQSLTAVQAANPAFAKTALGVQGRINETWQVGIRGNLQRFEDPTDGVRFGDPLAESSVMSMELRSSPTEAYRVASTKSSFLYASGPDDVDRHADMRAHNFEWQHGRGRVAVRYFEQDNLFRDSAVGSNGSNLIEIATHVPVLQTRRNDLGVAVRVTQESVEAFDTIHRTADVSANGSVVLVPSFVLHYGMASRIGVDGQELAPRTGAEWKITEGTSVVASAQLKMLDRNLTEYTLPSLVFLTEDGRVLPKYTYTFGIVSGKDGKNRLSAIASFTEADAPLRVIFADEGEQFWDGFYVEDGDVRRDLRVAYRREFGNWFAIDVATTAGTATQRDPQMKNREKVYIVGDLQSTFNPTRTSLLVSYREIEQPGEPGEDEYRSERINVRMAQSLYLPIDIKLLLGMEVARAENSPYLVDALMAGGTSRKYIGGLALNF